MLPVQLLDHLFRIREDTRIPCERTIRCVPARRAEARAQINESVAGQFLFTEHLCFSEDFLSAGQSTVRLLITETPERRHFCISGQASVFSHDFHRVAGNGYENIEGQRGFRVGRQELALGSSEIKCAEGVINEHGPSGCPNDPRNWYSAPVGSELVATLTGNHGIGRTATIELRPAFPEAQKR